VAIALSEVETAPTQEAKADRFEQTDAETFIADALARPDSDPLTLSIRSLLGHWNAKRRGYWIVGEIERDLTEAGLVTVPAFSDGWIDDVVQLLPIKTLNTSLVNAEERETSSMEARAEGSALDVQESDSLSEESIFPFPTMLRVSALPSAYKGIKAISPDATLAVAQSVMLRYDYSQLAVLSGDRNIRGAVSWDSLAQAKFRDPDCTLADAIVPADPVDLERDLLALIPIIVDKGFIFVRTADRRIGGIVTMADVSLEFANLAGPFFSIGEIERRLRRIIDECFAPDELELVKAPGDADRTISSAEDLTFGEYERLLEEPGRWSKLGWPVDRAVFIAALNEVRSIRNPVMHFSPRIISNDQTSALASFIKWLRILDPRP
jgi:CBS domain-containing protein